MSWRGRIVRSVDQTARKVVEVADGVLNRRPRFGQELQNAGRLEVSLIVRSDVANLQ